MGKPTILPVDNDRAVRLDSKKRVASAVVEGAMSIYLVHRYPAGS